LRGFIIISFLKECKKPQSNPKATLKTTLKAQILENQAFCENL